MNDVDDVDHSLPTGFDMAAYWADVRGRPLETWLPALRAVPTGPRGPRSPAPSGTSTTRLASTRRPSPAEGMGPGPPSP